MKTKDLFWIFPDYPDIHFNSKTSEFDLQYLYSHSTKEDRVEKIEEYVGLGIIQLYKNKEYIITQKGWNIWCESNNEDS